MAGFPKRVTYPHVLVVGSRSADASAIDEELGRRFGEPEDPERWRSHNAVVFVSGGARGVDEGARKYAKRMGNAFVEVCPHYSALGGKVAPRQRNHWMLDLLPLGATVLVYWDGASPGTRGLLEEARHRVDQQPGSLRLTLLGLEGQARCSACQQVYRPGGVALDPVYGGCAGFCESCVKGAYVSTRPTCLLCKSEPATGLLTTDALAYGMEELHAEFLVEPDRLMRAACQECAETSESSHFYEF